MHYEIEKREWCIKKNRYNITTSGRKEIYRTIRTEYRAKSIKIVYAINCYTNQFYVSDYV